MGLMGLVGYNNVKRYRQKEVHRQKVDEALFNHFLPLN
jgi:hypothetical protein